MKRFCLWIVYLSLLTSCVNSIYPSCYTLTKKYPLNVPDLELAILTDTTGVFILKKDTTVKQHFNFVKKQKYFLVIAPMGRDTTRLLFLLKNDTIIYYKKQVLFINKRHKLFFLRKK